MSDDIVTRLRGQRTNGVICEQAADEIERLLVMTADRDAWREYASDLGFYRSWADTLARALNDGDATKAYELAKDYKGKRHYDEF